MTPQAGQAAARLALFLIVASGLTLLWTRQGSAEFVVLVLTVGIGVVMLALVAFLARRGGPR
jgi:hypothetical protein